MKKKLLLNTATSLLLQLVTFVCGLILPRLVLRSYGSAVNGLVQSITQFLGIIAFMELGMGQVIQSALYKPLLDKNTDEVSRILASGGKFFRRIAYMLAVYVAVLLVVYPKVVDADHDWAYTAALIGAISISTFAQYYFGIIDRLLLNADQRGYIQYISQIVSLILNTAACVVLIRAGASIQMVKLTTSLIYLARPFFVRLYVRRRYDVNRKIAYTGEPIKQKWNGIAQHAAAVILENTDTVALTLLSTLENVSIYSVYHLIVYGVRSIYFSLTAGIQSAMGKMWAGQNMEAIQKTFRGMETLLHFTVVVLFSCTGILVLPFVQVYTDGITDVNYIQPLFAILITLAYGSQCLKTPYNIMVLAAGHYKQTQHYHIISAALNLVITVAAVQFWGLVGVAIGTLAAMLYQTVGLALYVSRHLIEGSLWGFFTHLVVDIVTCGLIGLATSRIQLGGNTYVAWFVMALQVALIALVISAAVMGLCYRKQLRGMRHWFA